MKQDYQLYLWEPETSPHKLPLFYELRNYPRVQQVTYVAERELNAKRVKQGWKTGVQDNAGIVINPSDDEVERIIATSDPSSVHIFSGLRRVPCIVAGLQAAVKHRRRFGILQEPRVFEGAAGFARLAQSWATETSLRKHASFVLAIGAHGPAWFRMTGYKASRIFPFAYFLPNIAQQPDAESVARPGSLPTVSYLGRLEKLKGIHLFVDSLKYIKTKSHVRIAGVGSYEPEVRKALAERGGFEFIGRLDMSEVPQFLSSTDVLVLPSITRDDGWGAVVSEALMSGAAVAASFKVGASVCVANPDRGAVIHDLSGQGVATVVDALLEREVSGVGLRAGRAAWASRHLDQAAGAHYLLQIMDHLFDGMPRPKSFIADE